MKISRNFVRISDFEEFINKEESTKNPYELSD